MAPSDGDPDLAVEVTRAIKHGDLDALRRCLAAAPELVTARPDGSRTLLHLATDWPGDYPNVGETIRTLVAAGSDIDAPFGGPQHSETPLHWAASNDLVEIVDVLLDAGADIEARGGVIAGGTPLESATAFAQWNAARRLVERGAVPRFWDAAALGMSESVEGFLASGRMSEQQVTEAFWAACHGGRRSVAQSLVDAGADPDWIGYRRLTPTDAALRGGHDDVVRWLRSLGARTAVEQGVAPERPGCSA